MLRARVINFDSHWDKFLFLLEFTYHDNYHFSIEMISFEALYSRRFDFQSVGFFYMMFVCGVQCIEREPLDKVKLIQDRFFMFQSRQKSYANRKVHDLNFMVRVMFIKDFTHEGCDEILKRGKVEPEVYSFL